MKKVIFALGVTIIALIICCALYVRHNHISNNIEEYHVDNRYSYKYKSSEEKWIEKRCHDEWPDKYGCELYWYNLNRSLILSDTYFKNGIKWSYFKRASDSLNHSQIQENIGYDKNGKVKNRNKFREYKNTKSGMYFSNSEDYIQKFHVHRYVSYPIKKYYNGHQLVKEGVLRMYSFVYNKGCRERKLYDRNDRIIYTYNSCD